MSIQPPRPISEAVLIGGPAGQLEALIDAPPDVAPVAAAVICHPHPLHGGTMTNKVAHMLAKSCNDVGAVAVRFNFRGVGASAGEYGEGRGETEDALAVLAWAAQRWPGSSLWLGGFSFGAVVAIRAAMMREVQRLITVAPAIQRIAVTDGPPPRCPWLLVQGGADELVDAQEVELWVASLKPAPDVKMLPGVDHFFHGRLNLLREVVVNWLIDRNKQVQ